MTKNDITARYIKEIDVWHARSKSHPFFRGLGSSEEQAVLELSAIIQEIAIPVPEPWFRRN